MDEPEPSVLVEGNNSFRVSHCHARVAIRMLVVVEDLDKVTRLCVSVQWSQNPARNGCRIFNGFVRKDPVTIGSFGSEVSVGLDEVKIILVFKSRCHNSFYIRSFKLEFRCHLSCWKETGKNHRDRTLW